MHIMFVRNNTMDRFCIVFSFSKQISALSDLRETAKECSIVNIHSFAEYCGLMEMNESISSFYRFAAMKLNNKTLSKFFRIDTMGIYLLATQQQNKIGYSFCAPIK